METAPTVLTPCIPVEPKFLSCEMVFQQNLYHENLFSYYRPTNLNGHQKQIKTAFKLLYGELGHHCSWLANCVVPD
jgi:hypothetical protein